MRLRLGEGLVGTAIASETPLLVNDVTTDPSVRDGRARHGLGAGRSAAPPGAADRRAQRPEPSQGSVLVVGRGGAAPVRRAVVVALVNARLFEQSRTDAAAFETLAEIGRDVASVLDLDQLFARIAQLVPRVIAYRTFGILLLNEEQGELEMKYAVQYGEKVEVPRVRLGEGLVGYAALHKEPVARRRRVAGSRATSRSCRTSAPSW